MLDAYIIESIRREEEARRRDEEGRRIYLELPTPDRVPIEDRRRHDRDEVERGPIVIPLNPNDAPEEDAA